jgi:hypothetical protein
MKGGLFFGVTKKKTGKGGNMGILLYLCTLKDE